MTSVASATTWGSPTATKHALLIHGLSGSSLTWYRVASALAAQGYLVTAPNLIGHVSRTSPDYQLSTIADDLRPYLEARTYTLIIGHSLGGATVLHILPYLSRSQPTALILVDPAIHLPQQALDFHKDLLTDACVNVKLAGALTAENPLWTREDAIYRELSTRLCAVEAVDAVLTINCPWNFLDHLNDVSEKWKVSVVLADPGVSVICPVDELRAYAHVRAVVVPNAGHNIPCEYPDAIVKEALKRVAELDVD